MRNALRHLRGESQKNIVRLIDGLSGKYSHWDIWQDFIVMSAIAIANATGGPYVKEREAMYRDRACKYSAKELEAFSDMLFEVIAELERDPDQDFLGELFMALGLGNEWKGQFFTPYDVCRAMSSTLIGTSTLSSAMYSIYVAFGRWLGLCVNLGLVLLWHILIPLGVMGMWTLMASVRIYFVGAGIVAALVWHCAEKRKAVRA